MVLVGNNGDLSTNNGFESFKVILSLGGTGSFFIKYAVFLTV